MRVGLGTLDAEMRTAALRVHGAAPTATSAHRLIRKRAPAGAAAPVTAPAGKPAHNLDDGFRRLPVLSMWPRPRSDTR